MSYYEHEVKVKIIDNILSRSKKWDWFIEYTENRFDIEFTINCFQDVLNSFKDIYTIFEFLCRIREFVDEDFTFTKEWLKELDQLAQFYIGKVTEETIQIRTEFAKISLILIYSGKIYSQITGEKCYFYSEIYKVNNLFSLININLFIDEEDKILSLFDSVTIDLSNEIETYKNNINQVEIIADPDFIQKYQDVFYNANCFDYYHASDDISTWEEREILNMLKVSYSNNKITPVYSNGSQHIPQYEMWTESVLEHISNYFNSDCVNFIVESIAFALYKQLPSEKTINKHFDLLFELSKSITKEDAYKMSCSSLEFIISFFNNEDCKKRILKESYINYSFVLNKLYEYEMNHILFEIKERKALIDKSIRKKLNDIIINRLKNVSNISNYYDFMNFISDKILFNHINAEHFYGISRKFDEIVEQNDSVTTASMFLQYFFFLLKIKNNKDVVTVEVSKEIIRIRKMWQVEYYYKCKDSLTTVQSESVLIPKKVEENYVHSIISNPFSFASNSLKLEENNLMNSMKSIAENPIVMMVSRITIAEDFPQKPFIKIDEKHPIDEFYLKEIEKQIEQNGYKFLNVMKPEEFASGIYTRIKLELQIKMSLLNNIEPLYNAIKDQNTSYAFIEFSKNPSLAHLTQLFPVLENKIREMGEMLGIVPVCESEELCHKLKEPDSILRLIISEVYALGEPLDIVSDLYFIHFCMYGENGLNIRNDCVHGNGYYTDQQISYAFKLTLICLYIVGFRCQLIIDNI